MAWELFTGKPKGVYTPKVSWSARGVLSLNDPAYELLGRPTHVQMFWEPDEQLIGLDASESGIKVRKQGNNNLWLINARPFGIHFKKLPTQTIQFQPITVNGDGRMVLNVAFAQPLKPRKQKPQPSDTDASDK